MHFDDLLKILGELGRYQRFRLFLICLVAIVCAFHAMNMVFVGAKPDYICSAQTINVSNTLFGNVTEKEIQTYLQSAGNCDIYDSKETTRILLSGNYTFDDIKAKNVTIPTRKCTHWDYSRDVYGPTIVTQVHVYQ